MVVPRCRSSTAEEGFVDLSPDGRWLAYESDAPGRRQIYVKRYRRPEVGEPVTTEGGREPRWSHDGKRLFFWSENDSASAEDDAQSRLMVVDLELDPEFRSAAPVELFHGPFVSSSPAFATLYDASPIEDSFVMLESAGQQGVTRLNVVLNWSEELTQRVPID